MSKRPIFIVEESSRSVLTLPITFVWYPGFSESQKRKSISSLHSEARKIRPDLKILEVSSKSELIAGKALSAFNLKYKMNNGNIIPLECAFQGSKIFEGFGQLNQLYNFDPRLAKAEARNFHNKSRLIGFKIDGVEFPMYPKTIFYDWLYIQSVLTTFGDFSVFNDYNAYSDIEFNPDKSINCQAYSLALTSLLLINRDPLEVLDMKVEELSRHYGNIDLIK